MCQRCFPVFASSATTLPSRSDANSTLPAVARTPLVSELWKILKSHIVLPVSGSSALMPADVAGSPGFETAGFAALVRPMYCRPASYGTEVLTRSEERRVGKGWRYGGAPEH